MAVARAGAERADASVDRTESQRKPQLSGSASYQRTLASQFEGVGKFAAEALATEARDRGFDHVNVIWEPGADGPEAFFHRLGFVDVGETQYGEVIGSLKL